MDGLKNKFVEIIFVLAVFTIEGWKWLKEKLKGKKNVENNE